jgi:chromosome segregation ATPase
MAINADVVAAVVSSAGLTGIISGVVSYFKDRKKDAATAKLTDVQALQQQVSLMESVTRFLRAENERLQTDYQKSEEARRLLRQRMIDLEDELQKVKRNATQTQEQCESLSRQLKAFIASDAKGTE